MMSKTISSSWMHELRGDGFSRENWNRDQLRQINWENWNRDQLTTNNWRVNHIAKDNWTTGDFSRQQDKCVSWLERRRLYDLLKRQRVSLTYTRHLNPKGDPSESQYHMRWWPSEMNDQWEFNTSYAVVERQKWQKAKSNGSLYNQPHVIQQINSKLDYK